MTEIDKVLENLSLCLEINAPVQFAALLRAKPEDQEQALLEFLENSHWLFKKTAFFDLSQGDRSRAPGFYLPERFILFRFLPPSEIALSMTLLRVQDFSGQTIRYHMTISKFNYRKVIEEIDNYRLLKTDTLILPEHQILFTIQLTRSNPGGSLRSFLMSIRTLIVKRKKLFVAICDQLDVILMGIKWHCEQELTTINQS